MIDWEAEYKAEHEKRLADNARIATLMAAIARAKRIDPYTGIGATGAALSDSDASSKYCYMYRDAVHDALELNDAGAFIRKTLAARKGSESDAKVNDA